MNRLVIIGNGFDLAHGLPTSYRDFINDYWKRVNSADHDDAFISFENVGHIKFDQVDNLEGLANNLMQNDEKIKFSEAEIYREAGNNYMTGKKNRSHILVYKNNFFKIINQKCVQNWVDIENEYYFQLKKIANVKSTDFKNSQEDFINEKKALVGKLNKDFLQVKELLEAYLNKIFEEKYSWFDVRTNEIEDHLKEEPNMLEFLFDNQNEEYYQEEVNLKLNETLLLSFNYTKTVADYSDFMSEAFSCNYIHGEVYNKSSPIIFGFGDEMDENYTIIENIDDNEYLEYFKSIQYLEHSNYKKLYNFIESEPFQVFIMGHSCGLSDRTLLSMIFENQNCLSVKVFYHQKTEFTDNYTEIIQNISRHFKDKKMLRNKVVEKRHCKPLIKLDNKQNDLIV